MITPPFLKAAALGAVSHGFFGRKGGVSTGDVAGLQVGLGADDDARSVTENRRRIVEAVSPGAALATVYQVHSSRVVRYLTAPHDADRPEADAMVTDRPGLLLGIVTADCAPVLFADHAAGVVGAAHAGWKGALGGICENTIEAMQKLGAKSDSIVAAIGPCIAQKSYEVSAAFIKPFIDQSPENERFFREGRDDAHLQFDLAGYVASRLVAAGVSTAEIVDRDTYSLADDYYSYRRSVHQSAPNYGRQISVIGLS